MKVDCSKDVLLVFKKEIFLCAIIDLAIVMGIYGIARYIFIELSVFILLAIGILIYAIMYCMISKKIFNFYKIKAIDLNLGGINIVDFKDNNIHYPLEEIKFQSGVLNYKRCLKFFHNDELIGIVTTNYEDIKKFLHENRVKYYVDEELEEIIESIENKSIAK